MWLRSLVCRNSHFELEVEFEFEFEFELEFVSSTAAVAVAATSTDSANSALGADLRLASSSWMLLQLAW